MGTTGPRPSGAQETTGPRASGAQETTGSRARSAQESTGSRRRGSVGSPSARVGVRRIRAVHRRLIAEQGPFEPKPRRPIIDELVMTVLSQHTSDANSGRAFAALKARFPTWEQVLHAPAEEIADAIRSGGLADQKAPRIKRILADIDERESGLDLSRLNELDDQSVDEYLCALPGVGPKTAACVLVFSMGRAAFPIDTHVHRIVRRLGWVDEKTSADQAHRRLGPVVPSEIRYELHMSLINHGRNVCRAQRPRCGDCVLLDFCDAGPGFIARGEAAADGPRRRS